MNTPNLSFERSMRLKILRRMAGVTAKTFSERHNIPLTTLKCWEAPSTSTGSLTKKGAYRVIEAIKKEGIECDIDWLLDNNGPEPTYINESIPLDVDKYNKNTQFEIDCFIKQNENAVILTIKDNGMTPFYFNLDTVGGIWKFNNFESLVQKNCIINTEDRRIICRKLVPGKQDGLYSCYATNLDSDAEPLILKDIKIIKVAPILRLWGYMQI